MSDENGQSTWQDKIKDLVTFVGGIGAISYAAGFIIVTTHLLNYGIIDWNLLNARYLSAGFLFIFLFGLTFLPFFYSMAYILQNHEQITEWITKMQPKLSAKMQQLMQFPILVYIIELVAIVAAFVPAIVIVFFAKTWYEQEVPTVSSISTFVLFLFPKWYLTLFIAGFLLSLFIHPKLAKIDFIRIWLIAVSVPFLLVAANFYAFEIYPGITEAVGGGASIDVSLVFDNESVQTAMQLINLSTNFTTKPLTLLGENDKDYYFLVKNESTNRSHAVEIDKGLVKGLIYNVSHKYQ